jgi:hypothetical protein
MDKESMPMAMKTGITLIPNAHLPGHLDVNFTYHKFLNLFQLCDREQKVPGN